MSQRKPKPAFATLFTSCCPNHYSERERALVTRALSIQQEQSQQQVPAFISVVRLLIKQKIDTPVILSTILAAMLIDGTIFPSTVSEMFGDTIVPLVASLCHRSAPDNEYPWHKGGNGSGHSRTVVNTSHQALLAIALTLIDLEQMAAGNVKPNQLKAHEALQTLAPLASRLHQRELRRRLENIAFRVLQPDIYQQLVRQIEPLSALDLKILHIVHDGLRLLLERNAIKGEIQGRIKSLYSLHMKMKRSDQSVQSIMDRIGLRIVVNSIADCYKVLGIVHSHFSSIPCCFDDYIRSPKKNGYQSLHTCIFPVRNICYKPVEIQIRTQLMNYEAEFGVAAHSTYKGQVDTAFARKHQRSPLLVDIHDKIIGPPDTDEFLWLLHQQIYTKNMVIFGPTGQIMHCPVNCTVGEYLQRARIELYPQTLILVNGKASMVSNILHDTDSIEVILPDHSIRTGNMIADSRKHFQNNRRIRCME